MQKVSLIITRMSRYHLSIVHSNFSIPVKESVKAINTLRKPTVAKIQKLQLMKQYFKDYKAKMLKDEAAKSTESFTLNTTSESSKGLFVKKKAEVAGTELTTNKFLFNFKDPSNDDVTDVNNKLSRVDLKS
jgi:hypothetical protein